MNNYSIKAGTTDVSVVLRIIDSTDGTPETGVVYNTSGIDLEYRREGAASTDITEATLAALTTAHTDGGFLHIGNGYYRLDLPDAAVASGSAGVLVHGTVTGMVVIGAYIQLVAYDPFDTVRLGLTALPNAAAEAAGGLYTRGSGAGQINQSNNGQVDANAARTGGTTNTGRDIGASVLLSSGTGTGQVTLTSGRVNADLTHIAAAAVSTTTAQLGVNVVQISGDGAAADNAEAFFDGTGYAGTNNVIPTVTTLTGHTPQTGDAYARLGAPAGASVSADVAAVKVDTAATLVDTAEIGAAGAGLTALATAANLANVAGYLDTEIAAILADTNELQTDWANGGRLDLILDARASQTSVDDVPTNAELATALGTADDATLAAIAALTIPSAATIADAVWDEALSGHATGGSAGAALSAATAPSAAAIADAVWDEAISGHAVSGSTGEALAAAGGAGDPWITALPGSYSAGQAGYIVGTNLNATVSSRASQTSVDDVPTNAELATALGTADDAVLARLGTPAGASVSADIAAAKADTAAIKAKTDSLTYTVAGVVDSNIQRVNDVAVTGTGASGDEWGP